MQINWLQIEPDQYIDKPMLSADICLSRTYWIGVYVSWYKKMKWLSINVLPDLSTVWLKQIFFKIQVYYLKLCFYIVLLFNHLILSVYLIFTIQIIDSKLWNPKLRDPCENW